MRSALLIVAFAAPATGCATFAKEAARVGLVATLATRATVDALDAADAVVQPNCATKTCLDEWRTKRDTAMRALSALHSAVAGLASGLPPVPAKGATK